MPPKAEVGFGLRDAPLLTPERKLGIEAKALLPGAGAAFAATSEFVGAASAVISLPQRQRFGAKAPPTKIDLCNSGFSRDLAALMTKVRG
jgi:hypothetical protein